MRELYTILQSFQQFLHIPLSPGKGCQVAPGGVWELPFPWFPKNAAHFLGGSPEKSEESATTPRRFRGTPSPAKGILFFAARPHSLAVRHVSRDNTKIPPFGGMSRLFRNTPKPTMFVGVGIAVPTGTGYFFLKRVNGGNGCNVCSIAKRTGL